MVLTQSLQWPWDRYYYPHLTFEGQALWGWETLLGTHSPCPSLVASSDCLSSLQRLFIAPFSMIPGSAPITPSTYVEGLVISPLSLNSPPWDPKCLHSRSVRLKCAFAQPCLWVLMGSSERGTGVSQQEGAVPLKLCTLQEHKQYYLRIPSKSSIFCQDQVPWSLNILMLLTHVLGLFDQ